MSLSGSTVQSQTAGEHNDLIKYEYNLASCYEAEYLLSLKLQEDVYTTKTCRIGSGCTYDDGYEVLHQQGSCPSKQTQNGVVTCTSDTVNNPLGHIQISNNGESEMMEIADGTNDLLKHDVQLQPPTIQQHGNTHIYNSFIPSLHTSSCSLASQPYSCVVRTDHTNGYSLMGEMGHGNTHCEGPSRKRRCFHPEI